MRFKGKQWKAATQLLAIGLLLLNQACGKSTKLEGDQDCVATQSCTVDTDGFDYKDGIKAPSYLQNLRGGAYAQTIGELFGDHNEAGLKSMNSNVGLEMLDRLWLGKTAALSRFNLPEEYHIVRYIEEDSLFFNVGWNSTGTVSGDVSDLRLYDAFYVERQENRKLYTDIATAPILADFAPAPGELNELPRQISFTCYMSNFTSGRTLNIVISSVGYESAVEVQCMEHKQVVTIDWPFARVPHTNALLNFSINTRSNQGGRTELISQFLRYNVVGGRTSVAAPSFLQKLQGGAYAETVADLFGENNEAGLTPLRSGSNTTLTEDEIWVGQTEALGSFNLPETYNKVRYIANESIFFKKGWNSIGSSEDAGVLPLFNAFFITNKEERERHTNLQSAPVIADFLPAPGQVEKLPNKLEFTCYMAGALPGRTMKIVVSMVGYERGFEETCTDHKQSISMDWPFVKPNNGNVLLNFEVSTESSFGGYVPLNTQFVRYIIE